MPTASDPEGSSLTFFIRNRPAWSTFDAKTGALQGTPQTGSLGTYRNISIFVSDGQKIASLPAFIVTVTPTSTPPTETPPPANTAPVISGSPSTSAREGTAYAFQPSASDANSDPLTFTIANRPSWGTFNVNTGALSGTPGAGSAGAYAGVAIAVSDGKATNSLAPFTITVASANAAPTLGGSPPTTATVGTAYVFTPLASDANGDGLTFSITNLPSWATFSSTTGRLQGTPASANVGTYGNIVVSVSDGQATARLPAFSITVSSAPNAAPKITGTPPTSVMQGTLYTFQPTASDADGDALTFSVANLPGWASFSQTTGQIRGTPSSADIGSTNPITLSVSDGKSTVALPAFVIAVQATAVGAASLTWQPPTQNEDGSALTNLAGYKVYWGPASGNYPNSVPLNNPGLATYVVNDLVPGTYYFAIKAVNSAGVESSFSNVATKTIR